MPNTCLNELTVKGPKDTLDRFIQAAKGTGFPSPFPFSLESLVPLPEHLNPHAALAPTPSGEDWYHWQNENWGTKWDVMEFFTVVRDKEDEVFYSFLTANSPCDKAFTQKIAADFPELRFQLHFIELENGWEGTSEWEAGKLVKEQFNPDAAEEQTSEQAESAPHSDTLPSSQPEDDAADRPAQRPLLEDLRRLIRTAPKGTVGSETTDALLLYWRIGQRLQSALLLQKSGIAAYEKLVDTALALTWHFGAGFGRADLEGMLRFAKRFPDEQAVASLSLNVSWRHFVEILAVRKEVARQFYLQMCRLEQWSVRDLRERIRSQMFEHTTFFQQPDLKSRPAQTAGDRSDWDFVFRDPCPPSADGLPHASEHQDVPEDVLRVAERYLREIAPSYAFVARKGRIVRDGESYTFALLMYHREEQELVEAELTIDRRHVILK